MKLANQASDTVPESGDFFPDAEMLWPAPSSGAEPSETKPSETKPKRRYSPRRPKHVTPLTAAPRNDEPPDNPVLREKIRALFVSLSQKLFEFFARLGADPLTPDEVVIVTELIDLEIGLVEADQLEKVRRGAKWVMVIVVLALIATKVWQILKRRKQHAITQTETTQS